MTGSMPPPGWFPDPHNKQQWRWWDGRVWTEETRPVVREPYQQPGAAQVGSTPVPPMPTQPARSQKPWYLRWWAIAAAVVFGLALVGSVLPEDTPATTGASSSESETDSDPARGSSASEPEPEPDPEPVDSDGDGVNDDEDYRPQDAKVQTRDDVDTDADGVPDFRDDFPKNANFSKDADGDGVADQLDDFPRDAEFSQDSDGDRVADAVDAFPQDPNRSEITLAMENALAEAKNYLDFSPFSRQGLIDQLSSDYGSQYNVGDATWAVNQLDVSWKKQAVRAARDYLNFTSFSRQGLIDQLSSSYGSKFTVEEATHAVNQLGL